MPDLIWNETAPLQKAADARRYGVVEGDAGVSAREVRNFQLVLLLARRGRAAAMRKNAKTQFGADPGENARAVAGKTAAR